MRDASLVFLLGFYGVAREDSLALAALVFVVTVLGVSLLGGLLELARGLGLAGKAR